jgi:GT2 family glycosyltransferase
MWRKFFYLKQKIKYIFWLLRVFLEKRIIQWKIRPFYCQKQEVNTSLTFHASFENNIITFIFVSMDRVNFNDLEHSLSSLSKQTMDDWQCVINDHLTESNPKIETISFNSGLSPEFLKNLRTKYVMFIQEGDELVPTFTESIINQDADIIYFDQGVIRGKNELYFLKPDWSSELWLSVDILYPAIFRVAHLIEVAKTHPDNVLAAAIYSAKKIIHLPQVLCYSQKFPWENKILRDNHFQIVRSYIHDYVNPSFEIGERLNKSLSITSKPQDQKISIIIPTHDHFEDITRCLQSIFKITEYPNYEIIIVDDFSSDKRVQKLFFDLKSTLKEQKFIVINGSRPFNFSRACNQGAAKATGELLLFLNNDTEIIDPNWLTNLAGILQIPGVGVVGPKLLYPDGSVQHAGIVIGLEGHASHVFMGVKSDIYTPYGYVDWMRNVSAVTGACMMVRRDVFEQVGGFDESLTLAFGDVDLCLRIIDAGYRIVYTPDVKLIHYEGRSRGKYIPKQDLLAKRDYFREKIKQGDPYYNPNLSRAWRIPTIRQKWEMDPVERYDKIIEFKTR